MKKKKEYITTGEAAAIFAVDPDTVLRWIKSGDIPAIRTPGGHYRIPRNVFLTKMIKCEFQTRSGISYCWEHYSESGLIRSECKNCLAYKSQTSRCYELYKYPALTSNTKLFCSESCEDCSYYNSVLH